jgi:hypothetical protein
MLLQKAIAEVFGQLKNALSHLTEEQYALPGHTLSHTSIGQHVRHIIEMFTCAEEGYESGLIQYENRKRDVKIESDKYFAASLLDKLIEGMNKPNKSIKLENVYSMEAGERIFLDTNYFRELAYNLEHAIHHMALIKIGILAISDWPIPEGFGVAYSTLQYRRACAQ